MFLGALHPITDKCNIVGYYQSKKSGLRCIIIELNKPNSQATILWLSEIKQDCQRKIMIAMNHLSLIICVPLHIKKITSSKYRGYLGHIIL